MSYSGDVYEARLASHESAWTPLARRWPLLVACTLLGALVSAAYWRMQQPYYAAEAVVVVARSRIPVDDVSNVIETIFQSDPVLEPVADGLNSDETPASLLGRGRLEATATAEGALEIRAVDDDPDEAIDLANEAADSFAFVAELEEIGTFSVFPAGDAARIEPNATPIVLVGLAVGLAIAVLISLMWILVFRPVYGGRHLVERLGADRALMVTVALRRDGRRHGSDKKPTPIRPKSALPAIAHAIREASPAGGQVPCICVVTGRMARRAATIFIGQLQNLLDSSTSAGDPATWRVARRSPDDARLNAYLDKAPLSLLLIREGSRGAAVDSLAEELAMSEHKERIAVLMRMTWLR